MDDEAVRLPRYEVGIDSYRAAKILIDQHGAHAPAAAGRRMQELLDAGDEAGAAAWADILFAIGAMEWGFSQGKSGRLASAIQPGRAHVRKGGLELREEQASLVVVTGGGVGQNGRGLQVLDKLAPSLMEGGELRLRISGRVAVLPEALPERLAQSLGHSRLT